MDRMLGVLFDPLTFLVPLLGVAWWAARRWPARRLIRYAPAVVFVVLWIITTPASAYLATGILRWSYRPESKLPADAQVLVVLGGGCHAPSDWDPQTRLTESSFQRCVRAAELYRQGPACPVLVTGGVVVAGLGQRPEAQVMRDLLIDLGVPDAQILVEDRATNTFENALESARIIEARGYTQVVLLTSSTHLLRAEKCFRRQGLVVVPIGCDYRGVGFQWRWWQFMPRSEAAALNTQVAHELVGLVWYWMRDRI